MPERYRVCGLGLQANVPIAGLKPEVGAGQTDVRIVLGALPPDLGDARDYFVDAELDERGRPWVKVARVMDGRYYRLTYGEGVTAVVDARGNEVWATWTDAMSAEDAASYLTGSILGFLLRLRGITCLHGSAVAIGKKAVAFAGPSGSGKSSTAAGFARLGNAVLTDDLIALREDDGGFSVEPALPRVHLWPQSAESIFSQWRSLPRISPGWDKRRLDLDGAGFRFQREPLPLAAIYFLGERSAGDAPTIEAMDLPEALIGLVADGHAADFIGRAQRADEFDALARLLDRVPARRVTPCEDLARVPELCEAIARDFDRIRASATARG
jgi:hypothetical protein